MPRQVCGSRALSLCVSGQWISVEERSTGAGDFSRLLGTQQHFSSPPQKDLGLQEASRVEVTLTSILPTSLPLEFVDAGMRLLSIPPDRYEIFA